MELALEKYGSGLLTRKAIMTPAIELATRGFHVGSFQYNQTVEKLASIQKYGTIAKYYLKSNGAPYKTGEVFSNPDLGKTLTLIAENGADEIEMDPWGTLVPEQEGKMVNILSVDEVHEQMEEERREASRILQEEIDSVTESLWDTGMTKGRGGKIKFINLVEGKSTTNVIKKIEKK